MSPIKPELYDTIYELLSHKDMSISEIAEATGIHKNTAATIVYGLTFRYNDVYGYICVSPKKTSRGNGIRYVKEEKIARKGVNNEQSREIR